MKKARRDTSSHPIPFFLLPLYPAPDFTTPLEPQVPTATASINHPYASPHVWYVMSSAMLPLTQQKKRRINYLLHVAKMRGLFLWRADVDFAFAFSR
jgi:hypothetical protein